MRTAELSRGEEVENVEFLCKYDLVWLKDYTVTSRPFARNDREIINYTTAVAK
jgi:hypothetical protein